MKSARMALRHYEKSMNASSREQKQQKKKQKVKKLFKSPVRFIQKIIAGKVCLDDLPQSSAYRNITTLLSGSWYYSGGSRKGFAEFLVNLAKQGGSNLFLNNEKESLQVLLRIYFQHKHWLRPLAQWTPPKEVSNRRKYQLSLIKTLFIKYDMPVFMHNAWDYDKPEFQDWYIRIGRGENIRKAPSMPVKLTKRMAHEFLQAPSNYSPIAGVRFGQILGMGASEELARSVIATPLGRGFGDEGFWETVLRFLVNNEDKIQYNQVNPIIDYIAYIKFGDGNLGGKNIASNSNFTMKGRNVNALMRAVNEWHRDLQMWQNQENDYTFRSYWNGFSIANFSHTTMDKEDDKKHYFIQQLTTANALQIESREMHHCVSSYAYRCSRGEASIWTVWLEIEDKQEKILTIELNRSYTIVQVRGKYNRLPTKEEMKVIKTWAKVRRLKIPSWLPIA